MRARKWADPARVASLKIDSNFLEVIFGAL